MSSLESVDIFLLTITLLIIALVCFSIGFSFGYKEGIEVFSMEVYNT